MKVLCEMISKRPSTLKVLDISWNELFGRQLDMLFQALQHNRDLTTLNLAMTSLHDDTDLRPLLKFIRKNCRLICLDFSGMFKTASQVKNIIKAIKKDQTLLSLHLSHTPIIQSDK